MKVRVQRAFHEIEMRLLLPPGPVEPLRAPEDAPRPAAEIASAGLTGPERGRLESLSEIERARLAGRPDLDREARYVQAHGLAGVKRYETPSGIRVYRLSVEAFPNHITHTYLLLDGAVALLVDSGTLYHLCEEDHARGFEIVRRHFGERVEERDIRDVLITHGHIDHFGRVGLLKDRLGCRIHIHSLDASILTQFDKRIDEACGKIRLLISRSGFDPGEQEGLLDMYLASKAFYRNIEVDVLLEDGGRLLDRYPVIHVPGHCPGQVCVLADGLLFVGDHVLSEISPHQAPNYIFPNMGLRNYLASLEKVCSVEGVRLVLPGHQDEMTDLARRVDEIRTQHFARFEDILGFCGRERTLWEIAGRLFGELEGYNRLLGIEEAAAHIEYLVEEGKLSLVNPQALKIEPAVPLRFVERTAARPRAGAVA